MTPPLKVFVSYAHEDEGHRETLAKHLSALEDEGLIRLWHDRKITGGGEWAGAIHDALAGADIVLLLISADFLVSDYCNGVELTEAIRLHDAHRTRVVPVILRSCDWEHSRFARFNALPSDGMPVVEAAHPDQRFVAVAKGLRAVVAELTAAAAGGSVGAAAANSVAALRERERARRKLTITKVGLLGIEVGPFEIPLGPPAAKSMLVGLGAVMVLAALLSAGIYAFAIREPLERARDAMRMARYDVALEEVGAIPAWLGSWPGLSAFRRKAELGRTTYGDKPDWERIGKELSRQLAKRPHDADLMVLEAAGWVRENDYGHARRRAEAAIGEDPKNAEAWFLLGLVLDLTGEPGAVDHYRKATEAAPDSPQYRGNLARALLDQGEYDEALREYRKVKQYPLARVEQGLAHWAKGELGEAADAQRAAVTMLDDAELSKRFYNRREWLFQLPDKGIGLGSRDKRCYAVLAEAASHRLAGKADPFPALRCKEPSLWVRELLADDLCRFVDAPQPAFSAEAGRLRQELDMPENCPVASLPVSGAVPSSPRT